jgi:hypothetical protein
MASKPSRSRKLTSARSLLYVLSRILKEGFCVSSVGGVGDDSDSLGTIEIGYRGRSVGYVNSDVLGAGVIGYNFGRYGRHTGAVSWESLDANISEFLSDHECIEDDVKRQGKEGGTHFVVVKNRKVAVKVLLADKYAIDNQLDGGAEA